MTRPTARQIVRDDANLNGWTSLEFLADTDIFARGDEELMMVWSQADNQRLAAGFTYRPTRTSPAIRDKSVMCIVNAREHLTRKN